MIWFFSRSQELIQRDGRSGTKVLKEKLGEDVCNNILFIHAILGCDTSSRIHRIGKGASLKTFLFSHHFRAQAQVFNNISASKEDVAAAGEKALVCLYNGKSDEGLDSLRYRRYCEKAATNTSRVQPQSLPPASAAAMCYSLRVYFQVQPGRVLMKPCQQKNGDGRPVMDCFFPF